MREKKFLVIGGSGFIGTNLVELLIGKECEVVSADIEAPVKSSHSDYFRKCDLLDIVELEALIEQVQPTHVVNLAARTDLEGSSLADYRVNTDGVQNLCKVISQTRSVQRFVHASSMLVCRIGHIPTEVDEYSADTAYGHSKCVGESCIRDWAGHLPSTAIVRPTSIWGPWFKAPYREFFERVMTKRFANINGSTTKKTYGFVENAVNEILEISFHDSIGLSDLIYLGDRPALSIKKWSGEICVAQNLAKPIGIPYFIFWCAAKVGDILGFVNISFPMTSFRLNNMITHNDLSELVSSLVRDSDRVSLESGVKKTVEWIQDVG